jgi:hypothetical protein
MTVTTAVVVLPRRMAIWAARRALARNSLTGIELGFSLCAAVWFSAGKPATALAGGAALGGGYLARRVGGQLDVGPGGRPPALLPRGTTPGTPGPRSPLRVEAYAGGAYIGWLAVVCGWAGELAVYAGLAVGAAGSPTVAWKLATGAAMLFALRKVVRLCRSVQAAGYLAAPPVTPPSAQPAQDRAEAPAPDTSRFSLGLLIRQLLAVPAWARALAITGTAAYYGNRTALLVLTYCGAVALAWSLVAGPHRPRQQARDGLPRSADAPGGTAAPGNGGGVAACRDDGPIARFAGALVHGQLVPLPPAVAGLTATVLLAVLGLGSLDGLVLLTPVAAMLLAAPGSAHPHDGPLDWLAPVIIQAGQYIYLAALGFAIGIPGPVTFGLIGLVALRQLDVAYQAWHPLGPRGARGSLGWEGRMLVAGFSAMVGLGTAGYLALMVYLGWLLCGNGLSGWLVACRRIARGGAVRALSG